MKISNVKLLLLLFLLSNLVGCIPSLLQKKINSKTYQPLLIHKSELVKEKSPRTLYLTYKNESNMPANSIVTRKKWFFIDLIVMYYYKYKMVISLGNNSCNPYALDFYKTSTDEIIQRSGNFTLVKDTTIAPPMRRGVITIKKMDIYCDYESTGFALGSGSSRNEIAGNAAGLVLVNLKVYNQLNEVVFENDYRDISTINHISSSGKIREIKYKAMKNLVEKLSASTQSIGVTMTNDLNELLK